MVKGLPYEVLRGGNIFSDTCRTLEMCYRAQKRFRNIETEMIVLEHFRCNFLHLRII